MKKIIFFIFIFLQSCSSNLNDNKLSLDFNFSDNIAIEEFKKKLLNYANTSSYPSIE